MERLAVQRAKDLFGVSYANVQPHSGTSANLAVYFSVLKVGDRILAMSLPHGGHLSHGHQASITSQCFNFEHYAVDPATERIDYDRVRDRANKFKPRMIVAGASSYPRLIDYACMASIAKEVGALLMADMAHLAGLVAGRAIPSPVPHCDFTTFTCYTGPSFRAARAPAPSILSPPRRSSSNWPVRPDSPRCSATPSPMPRRWPAI